MKFHICGTQKIDDYCHNDDIMAEIKFTTDRLNTVVVKNVKITDINEHDCLVHINTRQKIRVSIDNIAYFRTTPQNPHKNNRYPLNMKEISLTDYKKSSDLIYQVWTDTQYRQVFEHHEPLEYEDLQIIWIDESKNLGYAFGCKNEKIKFYRIGSDSDWDKFHEEQASKMY